MKKYIYLLIVITSLMFVGCKKQEQMVDFIPSTTSTDESGEVISEDETAGENTEGNDNSTEEAVATPTPKTIHVGETKTMYVKLDEYGAFLNVRSIPSKEGDIVGSLVHTEKIEVIDIVDGWASFLQDNEVRYVNADFLVDVRPDYIAPPSPTPTPKNTPTVKTTPTSKPSPTSKPTPTPVVETDTDEAPPEI